MYRKSEQYTKLRQYCRTRWGLTPQHASLLVDVELGLTLLQEVGLDDEPLETLWVLLSGLPIPDVRLERLTGEQRRAIANTRIILADYASRHAWARDLRDYMGLPDEIRQFDYDPAQLDTQLVHASRREEWSDSRTAELRACLYAPLSRANRGSRYPDAPGHYFFLTSVGRYVVRLAEVDLNQADRTVRWFSKQPRRRAPIRVAWAELEETARFLDAQTGTQDWEKRLAKVCFRPIMPDGSIGHEKADIMLDGVAHWAGIVGAGKSTLTTLIAVLGAKRALEQGVEAGWRTLLVQQETQGALALAQQFNAWFKRDAENDPAIATALLGHSTREKHAAALYASRGFQEIVGQGITHWGERILESACPLQATILPGSWESVQYKSVPVGEEPCGKLIEQTPPPSVKNSRQFMCPLFSICPSQQRYSDMVDALVWVTTAGALGQASIPSQLEDRPVRLGEIVYEQCDVVVFDEVDTLQEWFDRLYARETILVMHESGGLLQRLDTRVAEHLNKYPSGSDPDTLQWVEGVRSARVIAEKILMLLNRDEGYPELTNWIAHGHFTAMNLFVMLAHRLCGLSDNEDPDIENRESQEELDGFIRVFSSFQEVDPLGIELPLDVGEPQAANGALYQLGQIAKNIMELGNSRQNPDRERECAQWILSVVPDIEQRLEALRQHPTSKQTVHDDTVDTLRSLARRLEFTICAALLDRQTRIVFYQRHRLQADLADDDALFYRGVPRNLLQILPIPPTGRSFGIYYSHPSDERPGQSSSLLSTYGYTNIGRAYITDFNTLRRDIEGLEGPHTIAMSGTSYLPGSSLWHFDVPPSGVLEATPEAQEALGKSSFAFTPTEYKQKPIIVSGDPNKRDQLQYMTRALVEGDKIGGGRLGREIGELERLAQQDPVDWQDRARLLLLVNSYDQADSVAMELKRQWPHQADGITYLTRQPRERDSDDEWFADSVIARSDVERIAELNTRVLVAPLQAIGRALNILNRHNKAAFGSAYFLTRPMPYPEGVQLIAQEVNSRAMEWVRDPNNDLWQVDGFYQRGLALRQRTYELWRSIENRTTYTRLNSDERHDLAMTTAGRLIQAVGRLMRGDVPFRAYFVDAAWAPEQARGKEWDTSRTSLLAAMIESLSQCVSESPIGQALYAPLLKQLEDTDKFDWTVE